MLKFIKTKAEEESKKKIEPEKVEEVLEEAHIQSSSENLDKSGPSNRKKKKKAEGTTESMQIIRSRPNFFIGVKIFDKEIHENVKKIQKMIIEQNPLLYPALVPVSTLHVTLAVTHLANETEIKMLKEKLEEWSDKNLKSFIKEPIVLNFTGVKTFDNVVGYVDLEKGQNFRKLSELSQAMNDVLYSAGLTNDSKRFTPHLTILKLSKDYRLLKYKKNFKKDFELMKKCKDHFGKQEVKHIQLLSMNEPKEQDGYYKCFHEIKISEPEVEEDHSMCCSPIPEPKLVQKPKINK